MLVSIRVHSIYAIDIYTVIHELCHHRATPITSVYGLCKFILIICPINFPQIFLDFSNVQKCSNSELFSHFLFNALPKHKWTKYSYKSIKRIKSLDISHEIKYYGQKSMKIGRKPRNLHEAHFEHWGSQLNLECFFF